MAKDKGIMAVGRRKSAVARIRLLSGSGKITVNGKPVKEYFPTLRTQKHALAGLEVTRSEDKFDLMIRIKGGGVNGQSGAVRLGLARALQIDKPELRGELKKAGLLARDPRMVERKKFGLRKARRGRQFSKR